MNSIQQVFDAFNNLKVCIIGDVMIDAYMWGKVDRISPEAPVPIVHVQEQEMRLGGAANVALNIQALGAKPILCAVIGEDANGSAFLKLMDEKSMESTGILKLNNRPTTIKHRIIAGSQHLLRIDEESDKDILINEKEILINKIKELAIKCDVIIFEDYDKGVLSEKIISEIIFFANQNNIPTIVDPKKRNFLHYKSATLFKPNLKELREGLKIEIDMNKTQSLIDGIKLLKESLMLKGVLATLSEKGVFIDFENEKHHLPAHIREISDVSGAGDTVVSIAALCLALNLPKSFLAALSNLGGGIVCEYTGVVPILKKRLLDEAIINNLSIHL